MEEIKNVPKGTINRLKKKYQIALRRFVFGKAPSCQMREFVGLDHFQLKEHLSSMMRPGMNWNNYGDVWVISHVLQLSFFDITDEKECRLAWNYRNLMPLFEKDIPMKEHDVGLPALIFNKSPDSEIVIELRKRSNDEIEKIKERLKYYHGPDFEFDGGFVSV